MEFIAIIFMFFQCVIYLFIGQDYYEAGRVGFSIFWFALGGCAGIMGIVCSIISIKDRL